MKMSQWKDMPPVLAARYKAYLEDIAPGLAELDALKDELKKITAKLEYMQKDFGVEMRRMLREAGDKEGAEASTIKMDDKTCQYRYGLDDEDENDEHGVGMIGVDGNCQVIQGKPPKWVREAILKSMQAMNDQDDETDSPDKALH